MKRILFPIFFIVTTSVLCSPGFARQTVTVDPTQLSVDGQANGVDITGSHTLLVGVTGGTELDIYTNNPSPYIGVTAVGSPTDNDQGMVQFNVNSTVYGDMGATTSHVLHSITAEDGTTVTFLGSVYSTTMDVGTGTVNFNGGSSSTNTVATTFTGDGTVSLAANTTVTGLLTTNTTDTGTLELASGSQLTGAVGGATGIKTINVLGGSNTAGVSAGITGAVDTYGLSLGTNTLNISGALTMANGGTGTVIDTTLSSTSVYGHAVVTGGATSLGTGLAAVVSVPSGSLIKPGDQFNLIQGSGTGALATATDPTNPLYKFSVVTANGQAEIVTNSVPAQASPNPVVSVLLAVPLTAGLSSVLTSINDLTDPAAVASAVAQLNPSATALAAPLVTFQGAREFENLWLSRLDMCRQFSQFDKNDPSCQESGPHSGWWARDFGYFGDQEDRGSNPGYDSIIAGTMIAYDMPLDLNTRAGLGLGYARSIIDEKMYNTNTDFDTYQTTAYIGHDQGPWFINGSESFGWNQYRGMREIAFPGVDLTAKSGYSGQDYSTYVNSGFHIPAPQKFIITPLVSLQYSRVNIDSYTETGAGDIDLHVKPQGYDFLESGLGGKLERGFSFHNWTLIPDLHFKWLHDFLNPTLAQTAQFTATGSPSFYTAGLKTSADTYNVGTGITLLSCECSKRKWSLGAGYDYFWRNDGYSANQATLRVTVNF